jgi:hypothetical protein
VSPRATTALKASQIRAQGWERRRELFILAKGRALTWYSSSLPCIGQSQVTIGSQVRVKPRPGNQEGSSTELINLLRSRKPDIAFYTNEVVELHILASATGEAVLSIRILEELATRAHETRETRRIEEANGFQKHGRSIGIIVIGAQGPCSSSMGFARLRLRKIGTPCEDHEGQRFAGVCPYTGSTMTVDLVLGIAHDVDVRIGLKNSKVDILLRDRDQSLTLDCMQGVSYAFIEKAVEERRRRERIS